MDKYKNILLILSLAALGLMIFLTVQKSRGFHYPLDDSAKEIYQKSQRLTDLHSQMGPTQSGDWLESHSELGQTFAQYAGNRHIELTDERKTLYVLPLGEFNEEQMKIVELSAEFLSIYFMCEIDTMETLGLDVIPQDARRVHPSQGMRQINSQYVLHELLPPMVPDDAFAVIAFTTIDLYPEDDWNFVFGQASLAGRVGVWSLFRNGDPRSEFKTVLSRTLKTASHETGHMMTIYHCIAYECNMCGSNSQEESDRRPLYLCPECVAKVWLSTKCDPIERFKLLRAFCEENGLEEEAEFYEKSMERLKER